MIKMSSRLTLSSGRFSKIVRSILVIGFLSGGADGLLSSNFLDSSDLGNSSRSAGEGLNNPYVRVPGVVSENTLPGGPGAADGLGTDVHNSSGPDGEVPQVPSLAFEASGASISEPFSDDAPVPVEDESTDDTFSPAAYSPSAYCSYDLDTYEEDDGEYARRLDAALKEPLGKLLEFCKDYSDSYLSRTDSQEFDLLERFPSLLFNCIAANSQDTVDVNGQVMSVAEAMSLNSVDSIYEFKKSMQFYVKGRSLAERVFLYMMNSLLASLSSELYDVENRVMSEDKNVNLIINYLVYSGCIKEISIGCMFYHLNNRLSRGDVRLKDLAAIIARALCWYINKRGESEMKEEIKNCFNNWPRSFKKRTKEEADALINRSIFCDKIVFIKDWCNVTEVELGKALAFLRTVLYDYNHCFSKVRDLPWKVRECIRPYIMLLMRHSTPFDEYDDARLDECLDDILGERLKPYVLARRKEIDKSLSIARVQEWDMTPSLVPDLKKVLNNVCTSDQLSCMDHDSVWRKCQDLADSLDACLERYADRVKESYIANGKEKYTTNGEGLEDIACEIPCITHLFSSRRIRPICLLSEFIEHHPDRLNYINRGKIVVNLLMWNVFYASRLADAGPVPMCHEDQCVLKLVNYLVYAVGLDTIGVGKILEKLIGNLRRGEVGIKDFAISIYGLICDSLNECDSDEEKFKTLDKQIRNCFNNCWELLAEYPDAALNRSMFVFSQELVCIRDYHHTSEEIYGLCLFINRVLEWYGEIGSGYNSMKLDNLPGNVKEVIRPYIMLPLTGESSAPYTPEILAATFPEIVARLNTAMTDAYVREAEDAAAQRIIDTNNALGARQAIRRAPTTHQDIRSITRSSNIDSIASAHSGIDSVS